MIRAGLTLRYSFPAEESGVLRSEGKDGAGR